MIERLIVQLEAEIARLQSLLAFTPDREERVMLKSEIAYLRQVLAAKRGGPRRPPPEAGLPVPAVPPQGPLPKQGGAAASLDFES